MMSVMVVCLAKSCQRWFCRVETATKRWQAAARAEERAGKVSNQQEAPVKERRGCEDVRACVCVCVCKVCFLHKHRQR